MELLTELENVRILEVLRNTLNGELGVVMRVAGDHLELRGKTGAISRYKFGEHFVRVVGDEAVDFRALAREAAKKLQVRPRRKRTATGFLNKLKKG
jgi:hypothetical protein